MMEYISREGTMEKVRRMPRTVNPDLVQYSLVKGIIAGMPAADVAPVVIARWKFYKKENKAVCTNCSFERDLDADFGQAISCPNCGAKMDQ